MGNLVTGKVRFSFMAVFEPRVTPNGDEKYAVTLLIPKSDNVTYQKIMDEINRTLNDSIPNVFNGVRPTNYHIPIYDGDGLRPIGEPFGEECKNCWVITAKSNTPPEIVDVNCNPIINKSELYSGCYGRASIRFYAYNQNGNKGIGCGLGNIQKLEDGQPLGGRTTAQEDFATPYQETQSMPQYQAPVQQAVQQSQYQAPVQQAVQQPQIDPITGSPVIPGNTVNNIYGVN